jgi:hypothetical protein
VWPPLIFRNLVSHPRLEIGAAGNSGAVREDEAAKDLAGAWVCAAPARQRVRRPSTRVGGAVQQRCRGRGCINAFAGMPGTRVDFDRVRRRKAFVLKGMRKVVG